MPTSASSAIPRLESKQLARGKVTDRPWGLTVAALGLGGHTGHLTVTLPDRKLYSIAFRNGLVVDAISPVSVDSMARVALTSKMLPAAHAAEIAKRVTRMPERDEATIVADVAKLTPEEIAMLRRRTVLQRAARTFSIESGTYQLDHRAPTSATEIDVRAIVYAGAHLQLSDQRMFEGLRELGSRFVMRDEAHAILGCFELTPAEAPIVDALARGASLAEIEATHREIDPRITRAVVYALACCDAITPATAAPPSPTRWQPEAIATPRTSTETFAEQQTTVVGPRSLSQREIETLIADRCSLIDAGRDLFAVLGLEFGASADAVRSAYLELVRYVHPDRLATFDIAESADSQRLYAQAGVAYSTLCDPSQRETYIERHAAGPQPGDSDPASRARDACERAARYLAADRPAAAVAELAKACELVPGDIDVRAMLAWASFCAANDKQRVGAVVKKELERALFKSQQPEVVRIYLGRVERMLGHDLEALHHFREVLELDPDHIEAAAEIRVIEARLARGTKSSLKR